MGIDTVSFATIRSNGGHGTNNLYVEINGTQSTPSSIYCSEGDICRIDCQSSDACSKLHLFCTGTCFVKCNEQNGMFDYLSSTRMIYANSHQY